jgi:hypothetical protein
MNMEQAQNAAISFMQRQQARESAPAVIAPERKLRAVKAPKESDTATTFPSSNGRELVSVPGIAFKLSPGSYDARGFMIAWRRAKDRNEQIQAIAGYTGYDNRAVFSINEYLAMSTAKKALYSHQLTVVENKQETKSYVAGLPDNQLKRISDLVGREKLAADTLIAHELLASNLVEGSAEQLTSLAMADIERERLVSIRADLSQLVK